MPTIKLLMKSGPYQKGDKIEVSDTRARWLLAHRVGERVISEEKSDDAEDEDEEPVEDDTVEDSDEDESTESDDGAPGALDSEEGSGAEDDEEEVNPADEFAFPDLRAPVRDWVRYAVSRGMPVEEARKLSKRQLIEAYRK